MPSPAGRHTRPSVATVTPGCLDDDVVVAYAERRLSADQYAEASAHLDGCDDCLALVCAVARSATDLSDTSGPPARPAPPGPTDPPAEAAGVRQGEVVGRYVLSEMVGQGA